MPPPSPLKPPLLPTSHCIGSCTYKTLPCLALRPSDEQKTAVSYCLPPVVLHWRLAEAALLPRCLLHTLGPSGSPPTPECPQIACGSLTPQELSSSCCVSTLPTPDQGLKKRPLITCRLRSSHGRTEPGTWHTLANIQGTELNTEDGSSLGK